MKLHAYSVYDSAAKAFLPPFFMHNNAVAIRAFAHSANDENHQFCASPEDYTLWNIGSWTDDQGDFEIIKHEKLGTAASFLKD